MKTSELLQLPNLLSLSRVILVAPIAYLLSRGDTSSTIICVGLVAFAGVTDGLDGYLARRMGMVGRLGIALDPVCDKLFAGALVILLIAYRGFPVWLAAMILGRDSLIVGVGWLLIRGRPISLPSNNTGKYAFSAVAVLLASYVIRFPFGIRLMTILAVPLLIASVIGYGRVLVAVRRGAVPEPRPDGPLLKGLRVGLTLAFSGIYLYHLYLFAFA